MASGTPHKGAKKSHLVQLSKLAELIPQVALLARAPEVPHPNLRSRYVSHVYLSRARICCSSCTGKRVGRWLCGVPPNSSPRGPPPRIRQVPSDASVKPPLLVPWRDICHLRHLCCFAPHNTAVRRTERHQTVSPTRSRGWFVVGRGKRVLEAKIATVRAQKREKSQTRTMKAARSSALLALAGVGSASAFVGGVAPIAR